MFVKIKQRIPNKWVKSYERADMLARRWSVEEVCPEPMGPLSFPLATDKWGGYFNPRHRRPKPLGSEERLIGRATGDGQPIRWYIKVLDLKGTVQAFTGLKISILIINRNGVKHKHYKLWHNKWIKRRRLYFWYFFTKGLHKEY